MAVAAIAATLGRFQKSFAPSCGHRRRPQRRGCFDLCGDRTGNFWDSRAQYRIARNGRRTYFNWDWRRGNYRRRFNLSHQSAADLLPGQQPQLQKWVVPVIGVLLISGVLSLFASSSPDGLEAVAEKYGFKDKEAVAIENPTPLADYTVKGLEEQPIGTSIAGLLGSAFSFGTAFGIAQLVVKPKDV